VFYLFHIFSLKQKVHVPPLEKLNDEGVGQKGLCAVWSCEKNCLGTLSLSVLHALNRSAETSKSIELPNDGNRSERQGW
jgi:hypothetical protein